MNLTIWKFQIGIEDTQIVEMPIGAQILTAQVQNDKLCIWALVDPNAEKEKRSFEIFGTGHPVPENVERKYISTFQLAGGALIFHVFELTGWKFMSND